MKQFSKFCLKIMGWKTIGGPAPEEKCIIIGAPHTSAWDFVLSYFYYTSLGAVANVLIKKEFFFWPVSWFLRKAGGMPIDRSKGVNVIRQTIKLVNDNDHIHLALTPEGTRSYNKRWKAGFHIIAKETGVPVYLGYFDWGRKQISIGEKFELSDDAQADIRRMKDFYRENGILAKYPENFSVD